MDKLTQESRVAENFKILEEFAAYVNYDPEQTAFRADSLNYAGNRIIGRVKDLNEFDPSGSLAALYTRKAYFDLLEETSVHLYDVLSSPDALAREQQMYNRFAQMDMGIATKLISVMKEIFLSASGGKWLGEVDDEEEINHLMLAAEALVYDVDKLKLTVYQKSGAVGELTEFTSTIKVFDSLAECLLELEAARDGVYLAYVNQPLSADGWFGFFFKSGDNLFSIDDRIDEVYPGQHQNLRNGRYLDGKALNIFPYQHGVIEYGSHDYKGYARDYKVNEDKLSYFNLGPKAYYPLVLAMIGFADRYEGELLEKDEVYVSSLIEPASLPEASEKKLVKVSASPLALRNKSIDISFTSTEVLNNEPQLASLLGDRSPFLQPGQKHFLTEVYGEGFTLDEEAVHRMEPDVHKQRMSESSDGIVRAAYANEFIGEEEVYAKIMWKNARQQLADYVTAAMEEEFREFGGRDAAKDWFCRNLPPAVAQIERLCALAMLDGGREKVCDEGAVVSRSEWPMYREPVLNEREYGEGRPRLGKLLDNADGNGCSVYFEVKPCGWDTIEAWIGKEVPKAIKGWVLDGQRHWSRPGAKLNSLLDITDPIMDVRHPMETYNSSHFGSDDYYEFRVSIAFSKRHLKRLMKEVAAEEGLAMAEIEPIKGAYW